MLTNNQSIVKFYCCINEDLVLNFIHNISDFYSVLKIST